MLHVWRVSYNLLHMRNVWSLYYILLQWSTKNTTWSLLFSSLSRSFTFSYCMFLEMYSWHLWGSSAFGDSERYWLSQTIYVSKHAGSVLVTGVSVSVVPLSPPKPHHAIPSYTSSLTKHHSPLSPPLITDHIISHHTTHLVPLHTTLWS